MLAELMQGNTPPAVVYRGHFHTWQPPETLRIRYKGKMYASTLILLPSLCGMGNHARKATKSAFLQNHGMVAVEILDGEVGRIFTGVRELDLRTRESYG